MSPEIQAALLTVKKLLMSVEIHLLQGHLWNASDILDEVPLRAASLPEAVQHLRDLILKADGRVPE